MSVTLSMLSITIASSLNRSRLSRLLTGGAKMGMEQRTDLNVKLKMTFEMDRETETRPSKEPAQ